MSVAVTATFVEPTFAFAADPPPPVGSEPRLSNEGRAEGLFHSGEKKFDSGDYQGACRDFSESLKLGPKLGTLLNLALCHETTGKIVTAWSEFQHGAAWAAQNNQRDRQEFARDHIRSLETRLPRVVLQLPPERAISGIDLDGEPVPEQQWYLPLFLDPGEHMLAVTAPGKKRASIAFRVILSPTDQIIVVPSLPDADREMGSVTEPADNSRRTLGLVSLGVGAAGVIAGTTFGILATTRSDASAIKGDATVATISFVAGAAFAGVGGWLLWSSRSSRAHAAITPAGLLVAGAF